MKNLLLLTFTGFLLSCGSGSYDYKKVDSAYQGNNFKDYIVLWEKYSDIDDGYLARVIKIGTNEDNPFAHDNTSVNITVTRKGDVGASAQTVPAISLQRDKVCEGDVVHITEFDELIYIKKLPLYVAPRPVFDINANPNDFFAGVAFTDFEPDYSFYKRKDIGQIIDSQEDGDHYIITVKGRTSQGKDFTGTLRKRKSEFKMYNIYKWDILQLDIAANGNLRNITKMKEQKYVDKK